LARLGVRLEDATAPWQAVVEAGGMPSSWRVRDALVAAGASGLIDPSRQSPGLWHLVLFAWNAPGAPSATLA
ncbi:RES domain-containing protein, partial [Burkholderia cenocepacia]|uniref:RES domain-containing protein n=1 Tax=Burkholderia cenocepacia TaxID=95486 RepID=UPI0038CBFDAB